MSIPETHTTGRTSRPRANFVYLLLMKRLLTFLVMVLIVCPATAETMRITLGATSEQAVQYGRFDLTGNAQFGNDIARPKIRVTGLDLDGRGKHDDQWVVEFAVSASDGELARFARGYRLDAGDAVTLRIVASQMVLGTGQTVSCPGRFGSVIGNNRGATFEIDNRGDVLTVKSTSSSNNRLRAATATFDLPIDASKLADPQVAPRPSPVKGTPAGRAHRIHPRDRMNSAGRVEPSPEPQRKVVPAKRSPGEVLLPRLFGDYMVLQQQTKNTIWGWTDPGETIQVRASWGATAEGRADEDGRWKLLLDTPGQGTGHELVVAGGRHPIRIEHVAIGEVWLCVGQSNMGWSMGNSFDAEQEADVHLPDLRIFKSAREHWHQPLALQRDRLSRWKPCDPAAAAETSAVAYYFAKKLHQELAVPVGIIQQAYAGTPIEGWMPWEIQRDDPFEQAFKADLDDRSGGSELRDQALQKYHQELTEYNSKIDAGQVMKNAVRALAPPFITRPANLGHQYPGHQFNAMIYPIVPYGIRGLIWYQGERNSKNAVQAAHYRQQLTRLIRHYRSIWHERSAGSVPAEFPFQITQLPSWTAPQTAPVEGSEAPWAITREMMRCVTVDLPNTSMAVAIDTGDAVALHPKNKKPIGIRHAYLALKRIYGRPLVGSGPRLGRQLVQHGTIVLEFDSVGSGLMPARPGKLDAFAIAGADRTWHAAEATIDGPTVVVSAREVPHPVAVRYAWGMNPSQRNLLYNREGLPASPFRTDNWPLFDPQAPVVDLVKPAKPNSYNSTDWPRPPMTQ